MDLQVLTLHDHRHAGELKFGKAALVNHDLSSAAPLEPIYGGPVV